MLTDSSRDSRFLIPDPLRAVPCIRCGQFLKNPFNEPNQPNNGVVFRAYGQYGSKVFDPGDGSYIEINVCDACVTTVAMTHIVSFSSKEDQSND